MIGIAMLALVMLPPLSTAVARGEASVPVGEPLAVVDLTTPAGVAVLQGTWRYSDTRIVEVAFPGPGPDGQPTGKPGRTYDYTPHAGGADFDDSTWEVVPPTSLARRRGAGRIGFNWYRIRLTVPDRIADVDPTGTTVVFDTALDDYAEIWVDGELPRAVGQHGGSVVAGWNAVNRLVVGRDVRPGQQIQLAVFGINGPLSNPPTNFIWVRHARIEFHPGPRGPRAITPREVNIEVERIDPALDAIVGPNPKLWKLADGFRSSAGPVWMPTSGDLLFTDSARHVVYRYGKSGQLDVVREPAFDAIAEDAAPALVRADPKRPKGAGTDEAGNRWVSGPDGLRVVSSRGTHLGTIRVPRHVDDMVWGDDDAKTLYLRAGAASTACD